MSVTVAAPGLAVRGDAFRLEQAVENITANALRHTPEGGRIVLSAELIGHVAVLSITDSGEGILPEALPLIFDRFYKASNARGIASRGSGSGLGLSIVKAIIQRAIGDRRKRYQDAGAMLSALEARDSKKRRRAGP